MSGHTPASADHTTLTNQVSQYFQSIHAAFERENDPDSSSGGSGVVLDLSGLEDSGYTQLIPQQHTPRQNQTQQQQHQQHQQQQQNASHHLVLKVPQGNQPVKMCPFCSKTFQHSGSLGRHLDHQKGNNLHPAEAVDKIRSNVARRGNPAVVNARRMKYRKEYNNRDYVREKNKLRARMTSKAATAANNELLKFYRKIPVPNIPHLASFPLLVLSFLPHALWPQDPPTAETHRTLTRYLTTDLAIKEKLKYLVPGEGIDNLLEKVELAFDNWQGMSQDYKREIWHREQRQIAQQLLGNLTYFDFAVRKNYAKHIAEVKKLEDPKQEVETESETNVKSETYDKLDDAELAAVAAAAAAAVEGYDPNQSDSDNGE